MTYNIHSCIGMDGKISPERIARVIARYSPDIVALQELDVGRARTGRVDQADLIAQYLQMDYQFFPTVRIRKGLYGNAILTHFPMRSVRADKLPGLPGKPQVPHPSSRCAGRTGQPFPKKTLFGRFPFARIDHVFIDSSIEVIGIEVPNTELTRIASDHLPLIVEIRIPRLL